MSETAWDIVFVIGGAVVLVVSLFIIAWVLVDPNNKDPETFTITINNRPVECITNKAGLTCNWNSRMPQVVSPTYGVDREPVVG